MTALRPMQRGRPLPVIEDLFVCADRRAREAAVITAALAYVNDREGRYGCAETRYRRLRKAVRALQQFRNRSVQ